MAKSVVAFDFGASSGRAMLAGFDGNSVTMREIHRFSNDPVNMCGTLYWDTPRQLFEIKQGLLKAKKAAAENGDELVSVGIDTWGVDFGLLDKNGYLLENCVHYRDARTEGVREELSAVLTPDEIYAETGIQHMDFNTLYQLRSLKTRRPELLDRADVMLFVPDLFNYFLSGEKVSEYTEATTGQLINAVSKTWSKPLIKKAGLDEGLFTDIVFPGQYVGGLTGSIREELGLPDMKVAAVASHDTASAVAAVPCEKGDFAFLSSGTWSLMGTELYAPIISDASRDLNITNEGGAMGTITFLKNIAGLWLIQESRRQLAREGKDFSFAQLEDLARASEPGYTKIDVDFPEFAKAGDVPGRIRKYCAERGLPVPDTVGRLMRCIYEGLADKYAATLAKLETCTGKKYPALYVVGGGVKDRLLSEMTEKRCGVPVITGPAEATVIGNVLMQLAASGEVKDLGEARKIKVTEIKN